MRWLIKREIGKSEISKRERERRMVSYHFHEFSTPLLPILMNHHLVGH